MMDGSKPKVSTKSKRRQRAPNAPPTGEAMFAQRPVKSLAETLYQDLHKSIVAMDILPGTPLSENEIAAAMGVSRTPVREAILRLSDEKLVEVVPKSGTFVARIPVSALPAAQIARRALEIETTCAAARRATKKDIVALRDIISRQYAIVETGDNSDYHVVDDELHAKIAEIARLGSLWDMVQQVKTQIDRCRKLTLHDPGRKSFVTVQHEKVVDAIEAGDEELASQRMWDHIMGLQLDLPSMVQEYPNYFIPDMDLTAT
ncbi:GntR family transcriptional regulator [Halocynthiibacter sp. C4]|nr:GntR family transcriptional regulator [Halocynthiibacter sp. C4]